MKRIVSSFERVEMKYLLSAEQYSAVKEAIKPYMSVDEYGLTTICNLYFDTDNFDIIRHSIESTEYKEKLRLRSYGIPNENSTVYLEIKKKYDGIVYKRRIDLCYDEAIEYIEKGIEPRNKNQIFHEIEYFMDFYKPTPKLFLAYDRIAMYSDEDSSLRITFDHNIRSRQNELSLIQGDSGTFLFDDGSVIMEIKANDAVPIWLAEMLSEHKLYKTSFSKYGQIYKNSLIKKEIKKCSEASSTPLSV